MSDVLPDPTNFIEEIIVGDLQSGKRHTVHTRFPPEPNGYLHIGHAKSILLNYGLAQKFGGLFNLRFDDTDPEKESMEYVQAIEEDLRWLGCDWGDRRYFTSDYYEQLYTWAQQLITRGKAYVCSLSPEQVREYRGDFHTPGRPSPDRDRSVDENMDLFRRMRAGEFPDGAYTLRARIDMAAPNMNLRDPPLYRIKRAHHFRQGDAWCIYPMYDFAHGQSDSLEGITHSICTLEFEDHRPLYDWLVQNLELEHQPQQIEFARLNLNYTVMSKRWLLKLVQDGIVSGWDDPRMPTIAGLRRRGYTPESIQAFAERIGVAKRDSVIDIALLEHAVRDHLNTITPRMMGVLNPLKVVITNFEQGHTEWFDAPNHPEDDSHGTRRVPLTREVWVERDDFREVPFRKWRRLSPGREVRLRYACLITCDEVIKDDSGEVIELRCTWDPQSRGGSAPDGRKVKGTLHWVSAQHAVPAQVRLYDRLFVKEDPFEGGDLLANLNPDSLKTVAAFVEPALAAVPPGTRVQFERVGYFCRDAVDTDQLAFNRTVPLRDSWAKIARKQG